MTHKAAQIRDSELSWRRRVGQNSRATNWKSLLVAAAALLPSPRATLAVDLAAFLALLGADVWAGRLGWIAPDYLALRLRVTALVVAALVVAEVAI